MIQLVDISRQHGSQILFQNASFQILPATRSGLVGPNGAGKTTIFRLITGEEHADNGEIIIPRKTVIGYFSQDVGEMAGRSALEEVMAASSATVGLGEELRAMEAQMCEPMDDDAMAALLERYGEAQGEFEHRGGYDLESRAQTVLTGLVSEEELRSLYQHALAYVFPSFYEGFGFPPLEAMACGASVVTSKNGGVMDYAKDGFNSLLYEPGDVNMLTDKLQLLFDDRDMRQKLRRNGLNTAKQYTWDIAADLLEEEFETACECTFQAARS